MHEIKGTCITTGEMRNVLKILGDHIHILYMYTYICVYIYIYLKDIKSGEDPAASSFEHGNEI
jgi:hypothetical protein